MELTTIGIAFFSSMGCYFTFQFIIFLSNTYKNDKAFNFAPTSALASIGWGMTITLISSLS